MKNNLVRPLPPPVDAGPLMRSRSICGVFCSIWTGSSLRSLPRKKRRGGTMLWRMCTHSAWSRPMLQESSSSYPAIYLPGIIPDIPPISPSLGATSCYVTESVPPPSTLTNLSQPCSYWSIQQRRPHLSPSSSHFSHLKNFHRDLPIHRFRPSIQRHADSRLHTLSTRPTNYCRKTDHTLDSGPFHPLYRVWLMRAHSFVCG